MPDTLERYYRPGRGLAIRARNPYGFRVAAPFTRGNLPSLILEHLLMDNSDAIRRARELVDRAHGADPDRVDGQPAELLYADRMERWIQRLDPEASPLLRLAARCQHLERWTVPRESYPVDRKGYHQWRRTLYSKQAERAREILTSAGVEDGDADEVATWVSKTGLRTNPGTQALEDAACLVFLESEIESFAADHDDYSAEKFRAILGKIWKKMSPEAHEHARSLALRDDIAVLLEDVVG